MRRAPKRAAATGQRGLLDCPHYTRPPDFRGLSVPEVLLSGNHAQIKQWRHRQALEKTWRRRPELLETQALSEEDRELLEEIKHGGAGSGQHEVRFLTLRLFRVPCQCRTVN